MSFRPKILVDIDDTTLAWHKSFYLFIKERGISPSQERPSCYDLSKWLGVTRDRAAELIIEFNERSEYFANLEPINSANEALIALSEHFDIILASAFSSDPETINARLDNIEARFPDLDYVEFYALPLFSEKKDLFAEVQRQGVVAVIDDSIGHTISAAELGLDSILIAQSHNDPNTNVVPANVRRLDGWEAIKNHLISAHTKG